MEDVLNNSTSFVGEIGCIVDEQIDPNLGIRICQALERHLVYDML